MHFSFNLLRIKGLYMFRALLAHPQEALRKRHLVFRGLQHYSGFPFLRYVATVRKLFHFPHHLIGQKVESKGE
jgi:hypothetical protein